MVEIVLARRVGDCGKALEGFTLDRVIQVFGRQLEMGTIKLRGNRAEVVLVHRPDEFTKRRFRVKLEWKREGGRLVVRGKGDADVELVAECKGDELILGLSLHGKLERVLDEQRLREGLEKLLEALAPTPPPAPPAPLETRPEAPVRAERRESLDECIERLVSGGLEYSDELSRMIPLLYHREANTAGRVVAEGREPPGLIDTRKYLDGYDIRYIVGDAIVEIVRVDGRYGLCVYRGLGVTCGREVLADVTGKLCFSKEPIDYMIVKLP